MFFNLLINSTLSLAGGLLIVSLALWIFRIETGRWKLFLLLLPFLKIICDCMRGIPTESILLSGVDPFTLPPKHQILLVGAGLNYWGPVISLAFSVRDLQGREFASSLGDYAVIWLNKKLGPDIPLIILASIIAVSALLLLNRLVQIFKFEKQRHADKRSSQLLERRRVGYRTVDIYISNVFKGTPFTGGFTHPYICIPRDSFEKLSERELAAAIAHEMGHIRQYDLVITVLTQLLGDLFWFVPGYRRLSRKIDHLREIVADQAAVRLGADPAQLASALLKLQEPVKSSSGFVLYSAFFRERSLLGVRVNQLLGLTPEKASRLGWQNRWVRPVLAIWIVFGVLAATVGGNQMTTVNPLEGLHKTAMDLVSGLAHLIT
jgi:Zn-dependent protease with chaperone function